MTALVLKPFKTRRKGEIVQHNPGEKLQVRVHVVPALVREGFIKLLELLDKPGEPIAAMIYSRLLDDTVWVVTHPAALPLCPEGMVVYHSEEIRNLKGASPDEIRRVHRIKKVLGGRLILAEDRQ